MEIVAVALAAFLAASVQSSVAFGFSLVFVPLVSLLLGPRDAVATSLVLSTVVSTAVYLEHRPRSGPRAVAPVAALGIACTPLGLAVLQGVPQDTLRILVAAAVVAAALTNLAGGPPSTAQRAEPLWAQAAVGAVSGVLRGATSFAGPPVVLYYHWVGGGPAAVRSRLIAYMLYFGLPGLAIAVVVGVVTAEIVALALAGVPAVGLGVLAGRSVRHRLSAPWFRRASMAILAATSVVAVLGSTSVLPLP